MSAFLPLTTEPPRRRYARRVRRECFCGCGRRLGFLDARISKLGERHDLALAAVREIVMAELELRATDLFGDHDYAATIAAVEEFIHDGEVLRWRPVSIVHGDDTVQTR